MPDLTFAKYLLQDHPDEIPDIADRSTQLASRLMRLAQRCKVSVTLPTLVPTIKKWTTMQDHQLSGRALRKLPVLAYATYGVAFSQGVAPKKGESRSGTPVETWLDAMGKVIDDKRLEREKMEL
jgi:hypothetical protein